MTTFSVYAGGLTILGKSRGALIRKITKMLANPAKYAGRGETDAVRKALLICLDKAKRL